MAWPDYLGTFHDARPAVTERVLVRSGHVGSEGTSNPYTWLLAAVPRYGRVVDLACGSAPLQPDLSSSRHEGGYLGIDISTGELAAARLAGRRPLVRAEATAIPLADGSVDAVVCSMGLMILSPLTGVLSEIRRVLVPGGLLVATMPATGPLRPLDVPPAAGLFAALGHGLGYPNDAALRQASRHLAPAGLRLEADEARRFGYRLGDATDAERFLSSLYLPGLPDRRYRLARAYLRLLARLGAELPVPIRRIVARAEAGQVP